MSSSIKLEKKKSQIQLFKIFYYREKEISQVKDRPEINKVKCLFDFVYLQASRILLKQTNYLPIYHPQRWTNLVVSKEKWLEDQLKAKNELKKEQEIKELEMMQKYHPKSKFNEDEYI